MPCCLLLFKMKCIYNFQQMIALKKRRSNSDDLFYGILTQKFDFYLEQDLARPDVGPYWLFMLMLKTLKCNEGFQSGRL